METISSGRVAIVLLNWNGLKDTTECLSSLAKLNYRNYQTIVVDNASDEDITILSSHYPDVIVIRNQENYGYAKGNNVGIRKAAELGCEYCWVLNNDTEVAPDSLDKLVEALDHDKGLAAVTNLILYYDDRTLSWFAGGIFEKGLPAHRGYYQKAIEHDTFTETEYLSGCSFLARTDVLEKISGFDERYFCYVEDVDISLQIRALGHRIAYVPEAIVWHKVSHSTGVGSPIPTYYKHRNMLYFLRKFNSPMNVSLFWWLTSIRYSISLLLKHHRPKNAWYLIRALIDATSNRMGKCPYF